MVTLKSDFSTNSYALYFSTSYSIMLNIAAIHKGIDSVLGTCIWRSTFRCSILRTFSWSSCDKFSFVLHSCNLFSISFMPMSYSLLIFFCFSSSIFSSSSNVFSLKVFGLWTIKSFQNILWFISNLKMSH